MNLHIFNNNYFCSSRSFGSKNKNIVSTLNLLIWLVVVIVISTKHELFRDEVRALSIALEPSSLWHLPSVLKNEGHPILWYLILRVAFWVTHTPVILKVVSISVAFGGVAIFYRYAPFPVWQKILFIWGGLPLYEYSVMNRNYGISMFLFFLFAALYAQRGKRPFLVAGVLAALSNTNVLSCILAGVLAALWFFDDVVIAHNSLNLRRTVVLACAFVFIGSGIFFSIVTTFPTHDTIVTNVFSLKTSQFIEALWMNVKHPGIFYGYMFNGLTVSIRDVLLYVLVAGLLIRPHIAASLFAGMVLLGTFFATVYYDGVRHEGIFIIFMISLYWIVYQQMPIYTNGKLRRYLHFMYSASVYVILPAIFIANILLSVHMINEEIYNEWSSSNAFGKFIKTHSEYKNAIIMGEPDFLLESLPYYISNRIYIPREGRFGNRTQLTRANKARMSLGELLYIARQIRNSERKPVLIALGHFNLSNQQGFERYYPYDKVFTWSLKELALFKAVTVKVAEFKKAVTDENYEIYLLL